jgi:hypothetical protein
MVHVEFDTSPISVEYEYHDEGVRCRCVVYVFDEQVHETEWFSNFWSTPDTDDLKVEWTDKWEQFQASQFKIWIQNGSGTQAEE